MCLLEEYELPDWVIRNTKGHAMAFTAELLVVSYEWAHLLGAGTAHALWFVGAHSGDLPFSTYRVHGETGSIPVQRAAKLLQLVVNPVTFPGSGQIGGISTQAWAGETTDCWWSSVGVIHPLKLTWVLKPLTLSLCKRV